MKQNRREETDGNRLPEMNPGACRLLYDLSVRKGAGLEYDRVDQTWKPLPAGILPAGSKVQVLEVKKLSVSVWGRIQEGWICMYMSGTVYVEVEWGGEGLCILL